MGTVTDKPNPVVDYVDLLIGNIVQRPRMFAKDDFDAAETMVVMLLSVRAVALEIPQPDHRKWLAENYPEIPGSVRSVAEATRYRVGKDRDDHFRSGLERLVQHLRETDQ